MCGIAGAVGAGSEGLVTTMVDALTHRGPDGVGRFAAPNVALGHRRLAIIDVGERGAQPMMRGALTIVFNGEIYNYQELRADLEQRGERMSTSSDTEVLLTGFARFGLEWVRRLRGMFAFAVWDNDDQQLTLVRDRLGVKPLYYAMTANGVAFASEVRALMHAVPRIVDERAVFDYWRYGAALGTRTLVEGVHALAPGEALCFRHGRAETRRWYDLEHEAAQAPRAANYAEACRTLRTKLEEAARYHLVADVPVGAFLSAGVDSTAVVGLLSRVSGQRITTFTLGFDDARGVADERAIAKATAATFGTEHHELVVLEQQVPDLVEQYLAAVDVPSGDGANTFMIARLASRSVKVGVSGLGGDELFAGYPHFRQLRRLQYVPRLMPRALGERLGPMKMRLPRRLARALDELSTGPAQRFDTVRRLADDSEARCWLRGNVSFAGPRLPGSETAMGFVSRLSHYELRTYMVDTLLRDSDVMSMASGLELRPLLLDHPLVEWSLAQPDVYKLGAHTAKRMFIDATRDLLPTDVVGRAKTGFELPLGRWLWSRCRQQARAVFDSQLAHTLISEAGRALIARAVESGSVAPRIWSWFVMLDYLQRHRLEVRD